MREQLSLWGELNPYLEVKEPVILCEFFAGIGAQRKGIEKCGLKIDNQKSLICEWAVPSIIGYNAIHFQDKTDYSKGLTKEEMIDKINGISVDYNEPLGIEKLNKKPIEWIINVYNSIIATKDLINVMSVKGKDLGELPAEQTSILTYSFPCQDISNAGLKKGLDVSQANGGTRSGLLWEIERILTERKNDRANLPTILLMENVPNLVGTKHIHNFKKWEQKLRELGYSNYVEILNAKDYGIPQNRKRVFMISILGDYAYDFPRKINLKYELKDMLETEVDEKYFLSDKMINFIYSENPKHSGSLGPAMINKKIGSTITTREGNVRACESNYIAPNINGGGK